MARPLIRGSKPGRGEPSAWTQEHSVGGWHAPRPDTAGALRERIERNLHDGMQQRLVSLAMWLGLLDAKLPSDPDAAKRLVSETRHQLTLALEDLREITQGRDPAAVAERGLEAALEELSRGAGIPVRLSLSVRRRLPAELEAAAYYLASEVMTNSIKHSRARSLALAAWCESGVLWVELADDGVGGASAGGTGLRALAARIEALGGSLKVFSALGEGTTVRARIPVPEPGGDYRLTGTSKRVAVRLGTATRK